MKIEIIKIDGKWKVNGKDYSDLSFQEREFLNSFFRELKLKELN